MSSCKVETEVLFCVLWIYTLVMEAQYDFLHALGIFEHKNDEFKLVILIDAIFIGSFQLLLVQYFLLHNTIGFLTSQLGSQEVLEEDPDSIGNITTKDGIATRKSIEVTILSKVQG